MGVYVNGYKCRIIGWGVWDNKAPGTCPREGKRFAGN
ncbi:hypothetical protein RSAG8_11941, partial [Rhizoctonia solani AG-8 WAC10335]